MYYRVFGDESKEKILFLHGGGLDGNMWNETVSFLEEDYCCIVPDLPGHSKSANIEPFTTEKCVQEIEKLFEKFGAMYIVGLSLGGAITLRLLRDYPKNIKSAIISGTSSGISRFTAFLLNTYYITCRKQESPEVRAEFLIKGCSIPEKYRDELIRAASFTTKKLAKQMYIMIGEIKVPTKNACPLLILVGEKEGDLMYTYTEKLHQGIPNSTSYIVPNMNHAWSYEDPRLFANMIKCWIEKEEVYIGGE